LVTTAPVAFPILLARFFTERLIQQKDGSPNHIAHDRDTRSLLLRDAWTGPHAGLLQVTDG
jgi:hypothetical protein